MIEFRPLTEDDLQQLEDWLRREHVALWWRDDIAELLGECREAIAGREPTDHYVIVVDGRAIGMIQTYLAADHSDWEAIVQVGPGVAGLDILIGELDEIGGGLGPEILVQFVREVVTAGSTVATVDERNRRSWRAFEKAGFRHVRDVEEEGLPHRLMRFDR